MVTLQPKMAQTTASSTVVSLQLPSLTEKGKEPEKNTTLPQLAIEQLQKRIFPGKSFFQCQQLSRSSLDSLIRQSLSEQLCRNILQSLSEQLCRHSFQSLSNQLCRSTLDSLIRQLDLVTSLSLALLLGSRSCRTQLENKPVQQLTQKSFQLTKVQLCQSFLAQGGVQHKAFNKTALRTRSLRRSLTTRSWRTRSSSTASTTSSTTDQQQGA